MGVTVNIKEPLNMIKEAREYFDKTIWMDKITKEIRLLIRKNIREGKDYQGKAFHKYSNSYAKKKGSTTVNLQVSRAMVNAISSRVINALHGLVWVKPNMGPEGGNRSVIAGFHNFGDGRNPVREFMNIEKTELDNLVKKYLDDEIQKIINRNR